MHQARKCGGADILGNMYLVREEQDSGSEGRAHGSKGMNSCSKEAHVHCGNAVSLRKTSWAQTFTRSQKTKNAWVGR